MIPLSTRETDVLNYVILLHYHPSEAAQASEWLTRYQKAAEAWALCHDLVRRCVLAPSTVLSSPSTPRPAPPGLLEVVGFYAAQTIASLAQGAPWDEWEKGRVLSPEDEMPEGRMRRMVDTLWVCRSAPAPILRQLSSGVSALLILEVGAPPTSMSTEDQGFMMFLKTFSHQPEGYEALLDVLEELPSDLIAKRILINADHRQVAAREILALFPSVFQYLHVVHEFSQKNIALERSTKLQIRCFTVLRSWLEGLEHHIVSREDDLIWDTEKVHFFHPLVAKLPTADIFTSALRTLGDAKFFLQASHVVIAEAVAHSLHLTNIATLPETTPFVRMVVETISVLASNICHYGQQSMSDATMGRKNEENGSGLADSTLPFTEIPDKPCRAYCILLQTLCEDLLPQLLLSATPEEYQHYSSLLHLSNLLVSHPELSIRQMAMDVWFSLVGHFECTFENWNETTSSVLRPLLQPFVVHLMAAVQYPRSLFVEESTKVVEDSLLDEEEYLISWDKFREDATTNLTDAISVIGFADVVERAGSDFERYAVKREDSDEALQLAKVEANLFILTVVAPRIPPGDDHYISLVLELLPNLQYPSRGLASLIFRNAAARFVRWSTLNVQSLHLFGRLFNSLKMGVVFLSSSECFEDCQSRNLSLFRQSVECMTVEALSQMTSAAAASKLLSSDKEDGVTPVLGELSSLILRSDLELSNRCNLIETSSVLLSLLPSEKLQALHCTLVSNLSVEVEKALNDKSTEDLKTTLKLFFTALESVNPQTPVPPPPPSSACELLPEGSPYRHPVLDTMERFWHLVDRTLLELHHSELAVEYACHCVVRVFSSARAHCIRYRIFFEFLRNLSLSHRKSPSVFHLGAIRSMLGIFGGNAELPVLHALRESLESAVLFVVDRLREEKGAFMMKQPDLIGMTLDSVNAITHSAPLMAVVLERDWFIVTFETALALAPECHHPKVLMTMLLLFLRFTFWLKPDETLKQGQKQFVDAAQVRAVEILRQRSWIRKLFESVLRTVTSIFSSNALWLDIVANTLWRLLQHKDLCEESLAALHSVIEDLSIAVLSPEQKENFFSGLTPKSDLRQFCEVVKQLAEHCEGRWHRLQYTTPRT